MSWRPRVERLLDAALRVPSLFVLDSIFLGNFFHLFFSYEVPIDWTTYLLLTLATIMCTLVSFLVFCLDRRQLVELYSYSLSAIALILSNWQNVAYVLQVQADEVEKEQAPRSLFQLLLDSPSSLVFNVVFQLNISYIFLLLRTNRYSYRQKVNNNSMQLILQLTVYISLISPVCLRAIYLDSQLFLWMPFLSISIPVLQLGSDLYESVFFIYLTMKHAYSIAYDTVQAAGIQALLEHHWQRIHVPDVLRMFFVCRTVYHIVYHIIASVYHSYLQTGVVSYFGWNISATFLETVLVQSCQTNVALLGLTSLVSLLTHYIGMFLALCVGSETEEDRNMGTVAAVLFFILALQTGLTTLEPEKRLVRLYRNFCLLATAILHFVHNMVNPLLMSLSASRSTNLSRHLRVLAMCMFLIFSPMWLLSFLWKQHSASTWLLAVTAFSIEVIIKVFISLLVYLLFIIDAYRDTFWEKLDDYVYIVQSTGNTVEFLFGIFLFCNGAWIMLFESGGAIRAVMMCIHAYFNIWVQAKDGWKVFIKRRTAVNKINSLPSATQEQLESVNDVCAICYQELTSARVTRCHHYFHGVCLRKWLYVKDNCPLCHELIYKPEREDSNQVSADEPVNRMYLQRNDVPPAAPRAEVIHRFQRHLPVEQHNAPFVENHVHPHHE